MHPAYSVILFTTASGAGYGLLFWLSLAQLAGVLPAGWMRLAALSVALALVTLGLVSSAFHLGRPERAWRAFSQWRSSWLSREGVAAVLTYAPAGLLWLAWLFGIGETFAGILAALCALGAVTTVWCTGMIYASLRTIRQWNMTLVPVIYLAFAAASGGLLFGAMRGLFAAMQGWETPLALAALALALALKLVYWRRIDRDAGQYTAAQALGMRDSRIRQIDPPHTRPNYVMREMGYAVARKHARRLRRIAVACFALAFALPLLAAPFPGLAFLLAFCAAALGLVVERWLFFAEASHVSMLYYGAARA